jgi:uncharacterized membrane protein
VFIFFEDLAIMSNNFDPCQQSSVVVADVKPQQSNGNFVVEGRRLDSGRGVNWFGDGFKMVLAQPMPWILITVVLFVMLFALSWIPVINWLDILLMPVFMGGIFIGAHRQAQGGAIELGDLFACFKQKTGPLIVVGAFLLVFTVALWLIMAVVGVSSIFAAIGVGSAQPPANHAGMMLVMMFVIVIGMIVLGSVIGALITACGWFAPALIIFHDLSPIDAMKRSFTATMRNWQPSLVFGVLATLALFVGAIPFLLGLLLVVPALYASTYLAYRDIFIEDGPGVD